MKELKIDPELRDLLPHLPKEKFEGLEKMILEEGYDGTPILIWNGYIVDGHHRYKIFKKHNIEFNIEEISLPKDSEKSDVMDWMITYQDVRRNMCEAEKIYANDKVSTRRIEEENEKKRLEGTYKSHKTRGNNENDGCVQMDASKKTERDRSTNTREQRAKIAGVSAGTVARYDTVMNSDNKELQQSMLSGDVKIGTAYKQVINERKKENISNVNKDDTIPTPNNTNAQQADEQTQKICEFMKTERKGDYNYDITSDIDSLHYLFNKTINSMSDAIFDNHEMMNAISKADCDTLINYLIESRENINSIIKKMEALKNET